MKLESISADDPRLTAYALDEMEPAERAEFERLLRNDPAASKLVEDIRATVPALEHALAVEPIIPANAPAPRTEAAAIVAGRDFRKLDGGNQALGEGLSKVTRFPYYRVAGLAAACFAVGFVIWQANYLKKEQVHYTEIDLTKLHLAPAGEATAPPPAVEGDKPVIALGAAAPEPPARQAKVAEQRVPVNLPAAASPTAPSPAPQSFAAAVAALPTPAGTDETRVKKSEEFVTLSPFSVSSTADNGYTATHSTAGTEKRSGAYALRSRPEPIISGTINGGDGAAREYFPVSRQQGNTEAYDRITDNAFLAVQNEPLSTFSIDVDTASYANVRRFIQGGRRPPRDAVRIEELVNYFPYDYVAPAARDVPFAASLEVASAPWQPTHRLVRIGLKGRDVPLGERGPANLVFLLDVSGSMNQPNKLPLVRESMRLLVDKLRADDRVAIVVYAGASGLALPSTPAAERREILTAIDSLRAGGSTNGAMGIQLAYDIARANFVEKGVNRVVLCTDGDFNVGVTNRGDLTRLIEEKARSGVFLTVLGFGMGNYKDATLEQLADKGNGNYGYVDSRREAQKLLVEQAAGTLVTIAKDVKIQVEFNPAEVQAYRLIGYENRMLRKEDFNNDKIDAGEIGSGHTVTALYEVVPVGAEWTPESTVDPLKYQRTQAPDSKRQPPKAGELLTLKLRYKAPDGDSSKLLEFPLRDAGLRFEDASADFKFAAAVASFGMILRDSPHKGGATLADVGTWAMAGAARDPGGYRGEFVNLVKRTENLVR